jgi:hypothetical protein
MGLKDQYFLELVRKTMKNRTPGPRLEPRTNRQYNPSETPATGHFPSKYLLNYEFRGYNSQQAEKNTHSKYTGLYFIRDCYATTFIVKAIIIMTSICKYFILESNALILSRWTCGYRHSTKQDSS